jgi:glycerol uptake facilitator protein
MIDLEAEVGLGRYKTYETAQILCEYYPNPGFPELEVSVRGALGLEALGTFVLMLVILLIGKYKVHKDLAPVLIGLTITVLIVFIAPYTQAGFNPARDFGPRTAAYFLGWNPIAYSNAYWLYIVGPLIGAGLAAVLFPENKKSEG